jgi:CIC family chloride channel protein
MDALIDAAHHDPGTIRSRTVIVKLIASAITVGSGGSGGRVAPVAQVSGGFGSLLARRLHLSLTDGRIAVSVGMGSGIGAILCAPLGGAVAAAEITYRDKVGAEAFVPGAIASTTSYTIFGLSEGFTPLFGHAGSSYHFGHPVELLWFAVIGVLCGLVGMAYGYAFYGAIALADRLPCSYALKPAIGGLAVGLLALAVPQVIGTGFGWVQRALNEQDLLDMSLWMVLALPLAKIIATSLSIGSGGSGGSGGIIGPAFVVGAFVGAAVWRVLEPLGIGVPHNPAPFVIVGMMACFGSIARAPVAMMFIVAELTGTLTILAPAAIAVGIAYLIVSRSGQTLYRSQLPNHTDAAPS